MNYAKELLSLAAFRVIVTVALIFFPILPFDQTSLFISFVVYAISAYGLYYNRRWGYVVFGIYSLLGIVLSFAAGVSNLPFLDLLMIYYSYKGYKKYNLDEIVTEAESDQTSI